METKQSIDFMEGLHTNPGYTYVSVTDKVEFESNTLARHKNPTLFLKILIYNINCLLWSSSNVTISKLLEDPQHGVK